MSDRELTPAVTRDLADFACTTSYTDLPVAVRHEAVRSWTNFVGGCLGGSDQDAVARTRRATAIAAAPGDCRLIGRPERFGPLEAARLNCQASAAHAFDDTHLATVIHPAGPVAAPLFAEAERRAVDGESFLAALVVGVEVACRIGAMLTQPPAKPHVGWYTTSVASPMGAAVAVGRLFGLDANQMRQAIGIAANQAAGFRNTHGSMCTSLMPAEASRAGFWAALLAAEGVTSSDTAIEGRLGFASAFAPEPSLSHAVDGLGARWEVLSNMPKPYPCGIVVHPILDACLALAAAPGFDVNRVRRIEIVVNPLCLTLTDRPAPESAQMAQVSLQHWAAAALVRGAAGIPEGDEATVHDPEVLRTRAMVEAKGDDALPTDAARVRITLDDGAHREEFIAHATGSLARPMSDAEIDAKFLAQAKLAVSEVDATRLLAQSRAIAGYKNVGAEAI